MRTKTAARTFLADLQRSLERSLPPAGELRGQIRAIVESAKDNPKTRHLRWPEAAFLNEHVIPHLHAALVSDLGLSKADAKQALLSESYKNLIDYCSNTPARKDRHPFDKTLAPTAQQVFAQWTGATPLKQSCPDFALRAPSPHTIVFEGKYFERGSAEKAKAELVTNVYQAFFYRALPRIEGSASRPPWDYEFACLLACDVSPLGTLRQAWDSLAPSTRSGFWDGANVYIMILRNE